MSAIISTNTQRIEVVLAGPHVTTAPTIFAGWWENNNAGGAITPDSQAILTNGTTPVIAVPTPSDPTFQRILGYFSLVNTDTAACTPTIRLIETAGSLTIQLFNGSLNPGEELAYQNGIFIVNQNASPGAAIVESSAMQRVLQSQLVMAGTFLTVTNTAYFVYFGRVLRGFTAKFIEFFVSAAGAGTQTGEVGLFSTPLAPTKAGQSLTKLVATGTLDAVTGTGVKRNTASLNTAIAAGIHLWAGVRFAMATTQPTLTALENDMAQGAILTTATPGVLTGAGPFTGAIVAATANTAQVPDLRLTLD